MAEITSSIVVETRTVYNCPVCNKARDSEFLARRCMRRCQKQEERTSELNKRLEKLPKQMLLVKGNYDKKLVVARPYIEENSNISVGFFESTEYLKKNQGTRWGMSEDTFSKVAASKSSEVIRGSHNVFKAIRTPAELEDYFEEMRETYRKNTEATIKRAQDQLNASLKSTDEVADAWREAVKKHKIF